MCDSLRFFSPRPLLIGLIALTTGSLAHEARAATVRHVPGQYATIQSAINASVDYDTVEIAPGTYTGPDNRYLTLGGRSLYIRSLTAPATTVIDCEYAGGAFELLSGDDLTLRNITMTQGGFQGDFGDPLIYAAGATLRVVNCVLDDGYQGGIICISTSLRIEQSRIQSCLRFYDSGAGLYAQQSSITMLASIVSNNLAGDDGGGARFENCPVVRVENCQFLGNASSSGPTAADGAGAYFDGDAVVVRNTLFRYGVAGRTGGGFAGAVDSLIDCTVAFNSAGIPSYGLDGAGTAFDAEIGYAAGNLIYGNHVSGNEDIQHGATIRGSIQLGENNTFVFDDPAYAVLSHIDLGPSVLRNSIFVNHDDVPMFRQDALSDPQIECSDIWSPLYPVGTGDYLDLGGNITADPLFCNAAGDDYGLSTLSPCLNSDCGRMGARDIGCFDNLPAIHAIMDVKNDQGKQVSISWWRSGLDQAGSGTPVLQYGLYRLIDPDLALLLEPGKLDPTGRFDEPLPPGSWHYLMSVPARADSQYAVVAPTLKDSTVVSGMYQSVYFVSALTASPTVYFDSPIDSGYSVDNLEPMVPGGLTVAYNTGSGNQLAWYPAADTDFQYFRVYRGSSPSFEPTPSGLVKTTTTNAWTDPAYDGWNVHYKVTAVDFSGNESAAAGSTPTGVGDTPTPSRFALHDGTPNPFSEVTTIPFDVPRGGERVVTRVYDVRGRVVTTLVDGFVREGTHQIRWDGRDASGRPAAVGIYFVRMSWGRGSEVRKIALLR